MDAIFDAALDNDHKNQSAAWKLVMDGMLPISYFEEGRKECVVVVLSISLLLE